MQQYPQQPQPVRQLPPAARNMAYLKSLSKKTWLGIGAVVLVAIICSGICVNGLSGGGGDANANQQQSQPTATAKPTSTPRVVLTISGNGSKTSQIFHVSDNWQIKYTVTNNSGFDGAVFGIFVYPKGETQVYDDAIDYQAPLGVSSDTSAEHSGGDVYLKIVSGVKYTIVVTDNG